MLGNSHAKYQLWIRFLFFFVLFLFGEVDMRVGPASSAASPLDEAEPQ